MVRRYIWPGFARHVLRSNPLRTSSGETRTARSGTRPTRASRLERTLRRGRCVFDDARTVSRAASSQWSGHARSRGTCGSARPHSPGAPRARCRGGRSPSRAPQLPKGKVDRVGRVKFQTRRASRKAFGAGGHRRPQRARHASVGLARRDKVRLGYDSVTSDLSIVGFQAGMSSSLLSPAWPPPPGPSWSKVSSMYAVSAR